MWRFHSFFVVKRLRDIPLTTSRVGTEGVQGGSPNGRCSDGGPTLPNAAKGDLSGFSERPVSIVSEEKKAFLSGACGSSSSFLLRKKEMGE